MFKVIFGGEVPMFHHRIVELRKAKKITQEALSVKIGVTRSALSQYELGIRQPDYEIVKKIADYFNVTTDDLLGRKENNSIEETEIDKEKAYYANLIANIEDPVKKQQAIAFLEFLANSPTDGAKK
jgi:transcriptional regulator with XRE-family HTH domain